MRKHPDRRTARATLRRAGTRKTPGLPPGTLIYAGTKPVEPVQIRIYDYDADQFIEATAADAGECARFKDSPTTTWIDVDGVHDEELVQRIGDLFTIHPLTLEDVVHTRQRPKAEEYPHYVYVVLQMMHYQHESASLVAEQVSLIMGPNFLITFQESIEGDLFDPIRRRLRENQRIRRRGSDYLAYALIDVIVDHYMDILEGLGEHIENLEDEVMAGPDPSLMKRIGLLRRKLIHLRRTIWPLRDVITALQRADRPFISPEMSPFFRDVYDHTVRTVEMVESAREILTSMTDLHVSTLSFRMNEIMKLLAIIATFFMPLTFVVGIYGMNFNPDVSPFNMPELNWYFGYPLVLLLMAGIAGGMFALFRRRGWL